MSVNYNALVADPGAFVTKINTFLGGNMDLEAMAAVVDKQLYREKRIEA
jgi:hypothetical protein